MLLPTKISLESYHKFHLTLWEQQLKWELAIPKPDRDPDTIKICILEVRKHRALLKELEELKANVKL